MRYAVASFVFGLALVIVAAALGRFWLILLWPGLCYLLLAAGYAGLGPGVCGKRPDGRMAARALALLWPYLLPAWAVWFAQKHLSRDSPHSPVAPGLWLGRRVHARNLPPGVGLVVDLTCEFPEPRGVVEGRSYVCVPTLDGTAPPDEVVRELARKLADWPGVAYVHCALGHSRSALVAAAALIARGLAADGEQALALVRRARPSVHLTAVQRRELRRLFPAAP